MHPDLRLLAAAALVAPLAAQSQEPQPHWPQFRGPDGRGVAEDQQIPLDLGPERHVRWRVDVPGGHSSPCITGDLLVLTGSPDEETDVVLAMDRRTGAERWRRAFEREPHPEYMHVDAGPALPTPCTDGERLVVYLGGYGLVALDLEGETLWERRLPHPGHRWSVGTSPLIVGERVVLSRDGAPEAALLAFDLEDGSEAWKVDRFDYFESHGSPFLWRHAEGEELVVPGTRRLCSFDPETGKPLWTYDGITIFPCTTPTADADTLYYAAWSTGNSMGRDFWEAGYGRSLDLSDEEVADPRLLFERLDADGDGRIVRDELPECRAKDAFVFVDRNGSGAWEEDEVVGAGKDTAPGENVLVAIARGAEGEVGVEHVRWTWERGLPYVASPLLHGGRLWLFKAGGILSCLDAGTGEPVFRRSRLSDRSEYYMSPVGVGDVILAGSAEGTLYVLDATADELRVLHSAELGEELFATPAVVDGTVYLRAKSTLWAFGDVGE